MNIYAIEGHKVVCDTLDGGYDSHKQVAKKYLTEGQVYTVKKTRVDSWHTDVFLVEIPNVNFNSVFFKDVEPQSSEDDLTHPDFKRYNR